jgi:hypothetical protein
MPLFLFLLRPIDEGGEDLDQHMVAAEAEGRCLGRHARRRPFKLVRQDGASSPAKSRISAILQSPAKFL